MRNITTEAAACTVPNMAMDGATSSEEVASSALPQDEQQAGPPTEVEEPTEAEETMVIDSNDDETDSGILPEVEDQAQTATSNEDQELTSSGLPEDDNESVFDNAEVPYLMSGGLQNGDEAAAVVLEERLQNEHDTTIRDA